MELETRPDGTHWVNSDNTTELLDPPTGYARTVIHRAPDETDHLLAYSAEPVMMDYHSGPRRTAWHWAPYLLVLAVLMAAIALAGYVLAGHPGHRLNNSAPTPPPSPTLLTPGPVQSPTTTVTVSPQAPAPTLEAGPPAQQIEPPKRSPAPSRAINPDDVFLRSLAEMGWQLDTVNTYVLTVQGREVCAILAGPPVLSEDQAAAVVVNRWGPEPYYARQFVQAAHSAYCPGRVTA